MSKFIRIILASAALALATISVSAQFKEPPPEDSNTIFRADARLVILHATVSDRTGRIIPDLPQDAFRVFENGAEQSISRITRRDVPVSMGLVIDNSGSMRTKRKRVETSALALVESSNPQDEVFIVNFSDEAFLDQPFTSDLGKLERGLARISTRGSTAMYDAVRESIEYLIKNGKEDKKVLVVVTDGEDNTSSETLEGAVRAAQKSEVLIYTIGLLSEDDRGEARRASSALNAIADATGGQSFYPNKTGDIHKVCQQVAHDVRNQYIIEYSPINKELDGSFRQVKVTVNAPNHPIVRTRAGYYATPERAVGMAGPMRSRREIQ